MSGFWAKMPFETVDAGQVSLGRAKPQIMLERRHAARAVEVRCLCRAHLVSRSGCGSCACSRGERIYARAVGLIAVAFAGPSWRRYELASNRGCGLGGLRRRRRQDSVSGSRPAAAISGYVSRYQAASKRSDRRRRTRSRAGGAAGNDRGHVLLLTTFRDEVGCRDRNTPAEPDGVTCSGVRNAGRGHNI